MLVVALNLSWMYTLSCSLARTGATSSRSLGDALDALLEERMVIQRELAGPLGKVCSTAQPPADPPAQPAVGTAAAQQPPGAPEGQLLAKPVERPRALTDRERQAQKQQVIASNGACLLGYMQGWAMHPGLYVTATAHMRRWIGLCKGPVVPSRRGCMVMQTGE